jgi:hypothetical protein
MTTIIRNYSLEPYTVPGTAHGGALSTLDLLVSTPHTYTRRVLDQSYDWPYTLDMALHVAPVTVHVDITWPSCTQRERQHIAAVWNAHV